MPARAGVRSTAVVRVSPLSLCALSQQMRIRRTYGSRAYNDATHEFRVERAPDGDHAGRVSGPDSRPARATGGSGAAR